MYSSVFQLGSDYRDRDEVFHLVRAFADHVVEVTPAEEKSALLRLVGKLRENFEVFVGGNKLSLEPKKRGVFERIGEYFTPENVDRDLVICDGVAMTLSEFLKRESTGTFTVGRVFTYHY